jgi:restriction endonuclease S subunit
MSKSVSRGRHMHLQGTTGGGGSETFSAQTPEDWEVLRIGEMFTRRVERGRAGLPVMSITMTGGLVARDSVERRVDSNLSPEGHLLVRAGDLAYNMMRMWQGVLGRGRFDCLVSPAYVVLEPGKRTDPVFAEHLFSTRTAIAAFKRLSYGVVDDRLRLYYRDLVRIPFLVPRSQTEQRKIASILSRLDETIEQTEALIAKYQQIKSGMMQDLFTRGVTPDSRLRPTRVQAPHLYKESPLGWIPQEWEVNTLGAILRECGGYLQTGPFGSQLHAYEYLVEGIPVVMPQDINNGTISIDQIARISIGKAKELSRHGMKVGDVVIARRGDLSRAAAVSSLCQGWVCGTGCFLLRLGGSRLRSEFAAAFYRHPRVQRQIAGLAVGTTMQSLNNQVMERLQFFFCDVDEQERILAPLRALDQTALAQRHQIEKLRAEKQGLMQDLLTGRVRVRVTDSEVVSA